MKPPDISPTPPTPESKSRLFRRLAILAVGVVVANFAVSMLWQEWYRNGYRVNTRLAADRRDYAMALANADRWLEAEPESSEVHYQRGRILVGLDRPQEALAELERARNLGYPDPPLERLVGIIFARGGRFAQAEPMLRRDLERNAAPDAERDEALARVYKELYRFGPALEAIERWATAAPGDAKPYLWRAEVNRQLRADSEILADDYRDALQRHPHDDVARLGLANVLRGQGHFDQALAEYQAYLDKHPSDAVAQAAAGQVLLADGRENEAIRYLDAALEQDPKNLDALDGRASIALRGQQYAEALSLLDRALVLDPRQSESHYRRGLALDHLGRKEEAKAEMETTARLRREAAELDGLRKVLIRSPRDPEHQTKLAAWLLEHDREEEGLLWAERALATPAGQAAAALVLADYYERKGNAARANYYRSLAGTR